MSGWHLKPGCLVRARCHCPFPLSPVCTLHGIAEGTGGHPQAHASPSLVGLLYPPCHGRSACSDPSDAQGIRMLLRVETPPPRRETEIHNFEVWSACCAGKGGCLCFPLVSSCQPACCLTDPCGLARMCAQSRRRLHAPMLWRRCCWCWSSVTGAPCERPLTWAPL